MTLGRLKYHVMVFLFTVLSAPGGAAGGSAQSSERALQYSVSAIGFSIAGRAQLLSAAASIPLGFVGSVGAISEDLSDDAFVDRAIYGEV
jgi:hypothetical protein